MTLAMMRCDLHGLEIALQFWFIFAFPLFVSRYVENLAQLGALVLESRFEDSVFVPRPSFVCHSLLRHGTLLLNTKR